MWYFSAGAEIIKDVTEEEGSSSAMDQWTDEEDEEEDEVDGGRSAGQRWGSVSTFHG